MLKSAMLKENRKKNRIYTLLILASGTSTGAKFTPISEVLY